MSNYKTKAEIKAALQEASKRVGGSQYIEEILMKLDYEAIKGQGGYLVTSQNKSTDCRGLWQFQDSTWAENSSRPFGDAYDLDASAEAILKFTQKNASVLNKIGMPTTAANLYFMHNLGAGDGPKFLKALKNNPDLAPQNVGFSYRSVITGNPLVWGGCDTVSEAYQKLCKNFGDKESFAWLAARSDVKGSVDTKKYFYGKSRKDETDGQEQDSEFRELSKGDGVNKVGDDNVYRAQQQLAKAGFGKLLGRFKDKETGDANGCDGKFGQKTENAVKAFQKANGIEVTGVIDEATQKKLDEEAPLGKAKNEGRKNFYGDISIESKFYSPVKNGKISQGQDGEKQDFDATREGRDKHGGVDVVPLNGDRSDVPVYAITHSRVIAVGKNKDAATGYTLTFESLDKQYTWQVMHFANAPTFSVGDFVGAGQQIGVMGATGNAHGAHVHLTIRRDGKAIDPDTLIKDYAKVYTGEIMTEKEVKTEPPRLGAYERYQAIKEAAKGGKFKVADVESDFVSPSSSLGSGRKYISKDYIPS